MLALVCFYFTLVLGRLSFQSGLRWMCELVDRGVNSADRCCLKDKSRMGRRNTVAFGVAEGGREILFFWKLTAVFVAHAKLFPRVLTPM